MPKAPKGEVRPDDVIGSAVKVMRIATGAECHFLTTPAPTPTDRDRFAPIFEPATPLQKAAYHPVNLWVPKRTPIDANLVTCLIIF